MASDWVGDEEGARRAALCRLGFTGGEALPGLDRIAQAARTAFGVSTVLISVADGDVLSSLSQSGVSIAIDGVPLHQTFCHHTLAHDSVFVVPDARADRRFASNRFVTGAPFIRFYAGAPLFIHPTLRLGALCLIDPEPRDLSPSEMGKLSALAQLTIGEGWLRSLEEGDARDMEANSPPATIPLAGALEAPLTGAHVRAARGLLDWSIADLAAAAGVSATTIKRIEASDKPVISREAVSTALSRALAGHGVHVTASGPTAIGLQWMRPTSR